MAAQVLLGPERLAASGALIPADFRHAVKCTFSRVTENRKGGHTLWRIRPWQSFPHIDHPADPLPLFPIHFPQSDAFLLWWLCPPWLPGTIATVDM
jgi:hypothetical protein